MSACCTSLSRPQRKMGCSADALMGVAGVVDGLCCFCFALIAVGETASVIGRRCRHARCRSQGGDASVTIVAFDCLKASGKDVRII